MGCRYALARAVSHAQIPFWVFVAGHCPKVNFTVVGADLRDAVKTVRVDVDKLAGVWVVGDGM